MPDKNTNSLIDKPKPRKLLDQVREALRTKHYAYRTEQPYLDWIKRYIIFHKKRHPKELDANGIREFITYLATERKLEKEIILPPGLLKPSRPKRLPTVLTHAEAMSVIDHMRSTPRLMTKILYGSGLRLMECMCLRVKDIDFDNQQIIVRGTKSDDDRFTILPDAVAADVKHIIQDVKALHDKDLRDGYGETILPNDLGVKYINAGKQWCWQFIFPTSQRSMDRTSGVIRRHHLDESVLQKAIHSAAQRIQIDKPITAGWIISS